MVEFDIGDVRQADGSLPSPVHDQVAQLIDVFEAPDGAQQVTPLAGIDLAAGYVLVAPPDSVSHGRDREAAIGEPRRVEEDADLPLRAAAH